MSTFREGALAAASLAELLQARGLRVTIQKFDPYINIDPGTSHPFFIGTQFHPEFKSTPEHPQPIFTAFIKAALKL